jgi:hypothetical protein
VSSVALLSFFTPDYAPLHNVTAPVKDAYCARHGYRHLVRLTPYGDPNRYYAYARLHYLRDLLFGDRPEGKGIEVVAILNSHAQIMTHSITVESFLEEGKDFYIAADVNGLNAGVFIVRKSEWLKTWLDFILSQEGQVNHHDWKEQFAMQQNWERPEFKERIKIVDQYLLQGYLWQHYNWPETTHGQFKQGESWTLHVPGKSTLVGTNLSLLGSRLMLFSSPEILDKIVY